MESTRRRQVVKTAEASFRQGWQEALDGETRPVSELWDGLDADDPPAAGEGTADAC